MSLTSPPGGRRNPVVRIVLSFAVLGAALFFVIREGRPPKKVPVAPSFRSRTPSAEGSATFAWIPRYPGAQVQNIRTQETEQELIYGMEFVSSDAPTDITAYFERGLHAAAFTVETKRLGPDEINLHAEGSRGRSIDVGVDKVPSGSRVVVTAREK